MKHYSITHGVQGDRGYEDVLYLLGKAGIKNLHSALMYGWLKLVAVPLGVGYIPVCVSTEELCRKHGLDPNFLTENVSPEFVKALIDLPDLEGAGERSIDFKNETASWEVECGDGNTCLRRIYDIREWNNPEDFKTYVADEYLKRVLNEVYL